MISVEQHPPPFENPDEFNELCAALEDDWQPETERLHVVLPGALPVDLLERFSRIPSPKPSASSSTSGITVPPASNQMPPKLNSSPGPRHPLTQLTRDL